jgi:hypothetical protein
MLALQTRLAVKRATCTGSALANIGRKLVAKLDGLKRAAAVERLATITGAALSRNVVALLLSKLANCANVC